MRDFVRAALLLACAACASGSAGGGAASPTSSSSGSGGGAGAIAQLACGDFHTCARTGAGTVLCWGRDKDGELGDGGAAGDSTNKPTAVAGLSGVAEIAAGANFTCARLASGAVKCWGAGRILGDDTLVDKVPPTDVRGIDGAAMLRAGGLVACVRTQSGAARCWGLGAVTKDAPASNVEEVVAASSHACARLADGTARCWGEGAWSDGAKPSFAKPPAVKNAKSIATGDSHACVAPATGGVVCWGRNDQGELGANPDDDNHVMPLAVRNVTGGAQKLSAAESATCALMADASLRCWGDNSDAERGRGAQSTQELAGPVKDLAPVADVAVGADHVCVLAKDGTPWCWGSNHDGQIGDGTNDRRTTPVKVSIPR